MSEKILNSNSVAIWPILIEKTLVKTCGGYENLLKGDMSINEYLRDFTGAPSISISHKNPKFQDILTEALRKNELVYLTINNVPFMVDFLDEEQVVFRSPILPENLLGEGMVHKLRKNLYFLSLDEISELENSPEFSILKINNSYEYNSIHIPLSNHHYIQSIAKVGIQEEGTYHFSIVQKSKNLYKKDTFFYNKCTLTIGKLNEGTIEYINTITTNNLRETVITVPDLDQEGSFVVLVDI